jgi:methionyl-tRNA formyltransferase
MNNVDYPYIGGDPVEERHSYTYVPFSGRTYIDSWRDARQSITGSLGQPAEAAPPGSYSSLPTRAKVETLNLLDHLLWVLEHPPITAETRGWIRWMEQRFEVSKRVFPFYDIIGHRGKGEGDYRDFGLYLRLGELFAASFEAEGRLPSLNALLKCVDTLCSYSHTLDSQQKTRLARLIECERKFVDSVAAISSRKRPVGVKSDGQSGITSTQGRYLDDVVLLAADTARSRGYAQALRAQGVTLRAVLIVSSDSGTRWGQTRNVLAPPPSNAFEGMYVPDLRIPLEDTCEALSDQVEMLPTGTVNSKKIIGRLEELDPSLVIYSGFGGELVKSEVLNAAGPLLHMHAGWLPDYRGSTTIYYSILERDGCGVSAILLTPEIDAGEILMRRWYPLPSAGVELDYYYDSIVRADVLVGVINEVSQCGRLPQGELQESGEGEVYYIIHPVLKHLAILRLER